MRYRIARLAALFAALALAGLMAVPAARSAGTSPTTRLSPLPPATPQAAAQRLLASGDTGGRPFAIVDKQRAVLSVFHADGRLAGTTAALLGSAIGDHTVPGVGERAQTNTLRADDLTTPAGRFDSAPGRNTQGEAVVWVDYDAAFAIHRVRPGPSLGKRLRQLASADTSDNRVSAGCVVVPVGFFLSVVQPVLGRGRGVVYVLSEQDGWAGLWRDLARRGM